MFFKEPDFSEPYKKISYGERRNLPVMVTEGYKELSEDNLSNIGHHLNYIKWHFKQPAEQRKGNRIILRDDQDIFHKYIFLRLQKNDSLHYIGEIGYAYALMESRRYSKSIFYLKNSTIPDIPYKNFIIGKAYANLKSYELAEEYLFKELLVNNGNTKGSVETLVNIYIRTKNYKKAGPFVFDRKFRQYVSLKDMKDIAVINNNFPEYISAFTMLVLSKTDALGVLAALIICFIWLYYLRRIDIYKSENRYLIFIVLIMGMIFTSGAGFITSYMKYNLNLSFGNDYFSRFLYYLIDVALIEEIVKITPLLLLLLFTKKISQPYDYILYASISALGFAFIENIIYFETGSLHIMSGRALISVAGHMFDSSVIAYGLILARYRRKISGIPAFFIFLILAVLIHAMYDYLLFLNLYFVFICYYLICIRIWVTMINNALNNSNNFDYKIRMKSRNLQFLLVLLLTLVIAFEYLIIGYLYGPLAVNESLYSFSSLGIILVIFLSSRLSKFDLMKKRWDIINFNINPLYFRNYPLNFVGFTIEIRSYYHSGISGNIFSEPLTGVITDRLEIHNDQIYKFKQRKRESNWFLVKLDRNISFRKRKTDIILLKFKNRQVNLREDRDHLAKILIAKNPEVYHKEILSRNCFLMAGGGVINLVKDNE
jgi:RsiW-degrading membrane proteinase PrsW (M82 family)